MRGIKGKEVVARTLPKHSDWLSRLPCHQQIHLENRRTGGILTSIMVNYKEDWQKLLQIVPLFVLYGQISCQDSHPQIQLESRGQVEYSHYIMKKFSRLVPSNSVAEPAKIPSCVGQTHRAFFNAQFETFSGHKDCTYILNSWHPGNKKLAGWSCILTVTHITEHFITKIKNIPTFWLKNLMSGALKWAWTWASAHSAT